MIKTFKKLWSIIDLSTDLIVDAMKAVLNEIRAELNTPISPTTPPPPKFDSQTGEPIPEKK